MNVLATAVAKLTALSVPAKAATLGVAVALGATGGVVAYATDALDDVVEVTDDEAPTAEPTEGGDDDVAVVEVTDDAGDPGEDGEVGDTGDKQLPEAAAFGQSVAQDARDGGVDGQEIAARAHERNEERQAARHGEDTDEPVVEPTDPATPDSAPAPQRPVRPGNRP